MRRLRDDLYYLELGFRAPLDANAYLLDERVAPSPAVPPDGPSGAATLESVADADGGPPTAEVSEASRAPAPSKASVGVDNRRRGAIGAGERDRATPATDPDAPDAEGEVVLVDTGIRYNRRSLVDELADAGYDPGDVDRVLITHYDLDHVGGLDRPELDCPVHMGAQDVALVRGEWTPPLTHHKGLWHRFARRFFPIPDRYDLRPVRDGDRIGRFRAFHTPGHNPGHTVYVHASGVAFLGDLVWVSDGAYTTPFWADSYDMRQLHESVRRFADQAPPFEAACVGHGLPFKRGGRDRLRAFARTL